MLCDGLNKVKYKGKSNPLLKIMILSYGILTFIRLGQQRVICPVERNFVDYHLNGLHIHQESHKFNGFNFAHQESII
jgi:hypothetical protein